MEPTKQISDYEILLRDPEKRAKVLEYLMQKGLVPNAEKSSKSSETTPNKRVVNKRNVRTPLTQILSPKVNRIQNVRIESPSSLHRRRALEKLERMESESSENSQPVKPASPKICGPAVNFNCLLKDVVAYCEIISKDKDCSAAVKAMMQAMGASVEDTLTRNVTHVVFKNGKYETFQKARLMKKHLVSVLWLEAMRQSKCRIPEDQYPAVGVQTYDGNASIICLSLQREFDNVVEDEFQTRNELENPAADDTHNYNYVTQRSKKSRTIKNGDSSIEDSKKERLFERSAFPNRSRHSTPALLDHISISSDTEDLMSSSPIKFASSEKRVEKNTEVDVNKSDEMNIAKHIKDSFELKNALKSRSSNSLFVNVDCNNSVDPSFRLHITTTTDESSVNNSSKKLKSFSHNAQDIVDDNSLERNITTNNPTTQSLAQVENQSKTTESTDANVSKSNVEEKIKSRKRLGMPTKFYNENDTAKKTLVPRRLTLAGSSEKLKEVNVEVEKSDFDKLLDNQNKNKLSLKRKLTMSGTLDKNLRTSKFSSDDDTEPNSKKILTSKRRLTTACTTRSNDVIEKSTSDNLKVHNIDNKLVNKKSTISNTEPRDETANGSDSKRLKVKPNLRKLYKPNQELDVNMLKWNQIAEQNEEKKLLGSEKKLKKPKVLSTKTKALTEKKHASNTSSDSDLIRVTRRSARVLKFDNLSENNQSRNDESTLTKPTVFSKPKPSATPNNVDSSDQSSSRRSTMDFIQQPSRKSLEIIKATQESKQPAKMRSIVCTRFPRPDVGVFERIVRRIGGFVVEHEVSKRTTHLVADAPLRTINMLRAMAYGCWILRKEWLYKSLEAGRWLDEEDFEMTEFSPAVQKCRVEKQSLGSFYRMDIFKDCGLIYVCKSTRPRCSDLEELIVLCDGTITKNCREANVVIGEFMRYENVVCVNEMWILDSITQNRMKSWKHYLISGTTGDS